MDARLDEGIAGLLRFQSPMLSMINLDDIEALLDHIQFHQATMALLQISYGLQLLEV